MEQLIFTPDFSKGLLPAIAQDFLTKEVLMLAWVNLDAWEKTLQTGEAHYWSRSRKQIWHKGESSGHTQKIISIRLDCDSDAILYIVEQKGDAACHTGHQSCFYRELKNNSIEICSPLIFNPHEVYKR